MAGSMLAHAGVAGVLLVAPILSALDSFVLRANDSLQFKLPVTVVPAIPPRPRTGAPVPSDINPGAAPPFAPANPVTSEKTFATGSGTGVFGAPDTCGVPGNRAISPRRLSHAAPPVCVWARPPWRRHCRRRDWSCRRPTNARKTARIEGTVTGSDH
jgi:hypothetical protein